ncbi:polyprenyl synthetase family protein [Floccifex sp.]|uniref:polyprenyl synthetase family protein n=1 Tax=Floccifex sp. TaxID=2815810 RepID=UPI003F0A3E2D
MILTTEFEKYLEQKVNEGIPSKTKEAMSYSLMNGGKRIRPQLCFALLKGYGINPSLGFPVSCAIEMIHTYSLIHDDLPAMDNDDLRRGKPSCHKAFDEATAILAGDGLLTKAFEVALESNISDTQKVQLIYYLSSYAGIDGMIYGQDLDIESESDLQLDFNRLLLIDEYKTAKLLTLPFICACIIANQMQDLEIVKKIGFLLGIQFQMQDDILDVTQTSDQLGKSTSDTENEKLTIVSLLGLEKAVETVNEYDALLKKYIQKLHADTTYLNEICEFLLHRTY